MDAHRWTYGAREFWIEDADIRCKGPDFDSKTVCVYSAVSTEILRLAERVENLEKDLRRRDEADHQLRVAHYRREEIGGSES